jgi:hypothetical protein
MARTLACAFHVGDDGGLQGIGRQRTGRVTRVDARLLDMLHDAGDKDVLAIAITSTSTSVALER